ncbi:MAG: hypothetical protein JSU92_07995 [Deltaproteobacteria bacterium]|nr:MAG: hypothetical protein JSU92_07995 [Deltaproteobacteria bacterium]
MKSSIEKTLNALFKLEDLRQIWRDTVPQHRLSPEQKDTAQQLVNGIKDDMDFILGELNK